jgi:hypothetical protein
VKDDADGGVKIGGQSAGERRQRLDASCGRAHDDDGRRRLVHPGVVSRGGGPKQRVGCRRGGNRRDMVRRAGIAIAAGLAGIVGTLALLAVFVFWGASNSSDALPYFAVPGVSLGLSAVLGYRAWTRPPIR